jgi:acetolactate synthase small subunit
MSSVKGRKTMTEETNLEEALSDETTATEAVETPTPEPVAEPEQQEQPEAAEVEGGVTVPLKALQAERDERKALARELAEFKQSLIQQQPKAEPEPIPDPIEDPQAFAEYTQRQINQSVQTVEQRYENQRLNLSEAHAVKAHGQEAVEAMKSWFKDQPAPLQQEVLAQADPYDYAVQQHKRQSLTDQLTADPEKLERVLKLLEGQEQPAPKAPTTTATAQSVGSRRGPEWPGPAKLTDLLNDE